MGKLETATGEWTDRVLGCQLGGGWPALQQRGTGIFIPSHWAWAGQDMAGVGEGCTTPCASDTVMRYSPRPHRVFVLAAIYRRSKKVAVM